MAMDISKPGDFGTLFGLTCAHTANDAQSASNPYFRLIGFLQGLWFDPMTNRESWAKAVIQSAGGQASGLLRRSKGVADIFASDDFRKSFDDALRRSGHSSVPAFIQMLFGDFLEFSGLQEMPAWQALVSPRPHEGVIAMFFKKKTAVQKLRERPD
jgi:hypothetical protein